MLALCALVAAPALALAQRRPADVECKATETQAECHARLQCKPDEEVKDCQKRLLKCTANETLEACEARLGGAAGNKNNGGNGHNDQGNRNGDRDRDRDRDRDQNRNPRDRDQGDQNNNDRDRDRGDRDRDRGDRDRDRGDRDRGDRDEASGSRRTRRGGRDHRGFDANKKFGLGLELGEPSGLNGKVFVTHNGAIDFGVGEIYDHYYFGDGFHVYADYLWHPTVLASSPALEMPFYIGVGLRYWNFNYCYLGLCDYGGSAVGIRVPLGVALDFNNSPIDIFLQIVPVLDFLGGDYYNQYRDREHFGIDGSFGIRFWFK